jgi:hypothetical protein
MFRGEEGVLFCRALRMGWNAAGWLFDMTPEPPRRRCRLQTSRGSREPRQQRRRALMCTRQRCFPIAAESRRMRSYYFAPLRRSEFYSFTSKCRKDYSPFIEFSLPFNKSRSESRGAGGHLRSDAYFAKRKLRQSRVLEAGGAGGGGAHFWGVDTKAEMREIGLAEGH